MKLNDADKLIWSVPPEVVMDKYKYVYRCSECGWRMLAYRDGLFNYCPSCGAKQSWVKDETES